MSALTSWLLLLAVGIPWAIGVLVIVRSLTRSCHTEQLHVESHTIERLERSGEGER